MVLTPLVVAIGLIIGMLRGGRFDAILMTRIRLVPVLVLGVVLQTIGETFDIPGRVVIVALGLLCLAICASRNIHIPGAAVAGIGITLNLAVLLANGYIPVRFESLTAFGNRVAINPAAAQSGLWQLEADDTSLTFLGDIVPIPVLGSVISFGDCIMLAGLLVLAMNIVLQGRTVGIGVEDLFGQPFEDYDTGTEPGVMNGIPAGASVIEPDELLGLELDHEDEPSQASPPVQVVPLDDRPERPANTDWETPSEVDLRETPPIEDRHRTERSGSSLSWDEAVARLDANTADASFSGADEAPPIDLDAMDLAGPDDVPEWQHTGEVRRALFDDVSDSESRD